MTSRRSLHRSHVRSMLIRAHRVTKQARGKRLSSNFQPPGVLDKMHTPRQGVWSMEPTTMSTSRDNTCAQRPEQVLMPFERHACRQV